MSMPASPRWDHLRKQAKDLLRAARAGDTEARSRIAAHFPNVPAGSVTLAQAQLTVARHYGFPSWTKLKRYVEAALAAPDRPFRREISYYEDRAEGLLSVLQSGLPSAVTLVRASHPHFADPDVPIAEFTPDDARLVVARRHGFPDWPAFAEHIAALSSGEREEPFMQAFEAMEARDVPRLRYLLATHPDLLKARGTNGNTLMNLAAGLETSADLSHPPDAVEGGAALLLSVLLAAGADADAANDRGWTPLHQAAYSNNTRLVEQLLSLGADVTASAHGDGGTPLMMALFWGHRDTADRLAAEGVHPRNLRAAAGLGRLDLLDEMVRADGTLSPGAAAHRAFYRPHSGFPMWRPGGDTAEILNEGLVYAARNGRTDAMAFLLDRGAEPDAEPYNATALHWAAANGHVNAVRLLAERGADVNRLAALGGTTGITALHAAAWNGRMETVNALLELDADPARRDPTYNGFPWGWAEHAGHAAVRERLLEAGAARNIFHAIAAGRADRVAALLDADAALVSRPDNWALPLADAAERGNEGIVRLLLARGANPDQRDPRGRTARAAALEAGHAEVAALLDGSSLIREWPSFP